MQAMPKRRTPRRVISLLATIGLVAGMMASLASARSLTLRTDPDDTHSLPDIRKVWSDVSGAVYIRIRTWDQRYRDRSFSVLLDTTGSYRFDRIIEISGRDCVVEKLENGYLGDFIGKRGSTRPGMRDIACQVPAGWFSIDKPVRFVVKSGTAGSPHDDRAPNARRYIGL